VFCVLGKILCICCRSTELVDSAAATDLRPLQLRLPVWLVHNETGSPDESQRQLVSQLSQPCYGLALPQDADQFHSVPDLARAYVKAARDVQGVGPYLIVGCSVFGSLVATSMASQLERRGSTTYFALYSLTLSLRSVRPWLVNLVKRFIWLWALCMKTCLMADRMTNEPISHA